MSHKRRAVKSREWVGVLLSLLLVQNSWAQSVGSTGFNTPTPPFLNLGQTMGQIQSIQTSCNMTMLPSMAGNLGQSLASNACTDVWSKLGAGISGLGGNFTINSTCPEPGELPEVSSCAEITSVGESALMGQVCSSLSALSCRKGKMDAIKGEVDCLAQQANLLNQQISQLQQAFTLNIQQMQKDVAQLDLEIKDRDAQVADIDQKLKGSDSGAKGLLDLSSQIQASVAGLPNQIEQIRLQEKGLADARKAFDNEVDTRTMTLVEECFTQQKKAGFQCERNGPPVSAKEYALCRLQQESQVGVGGEIRTDQAFQDKAMAQRNALDSVFSDIFGGAAAAPEGGAPAAGGVESGVEELRGIRSVTDFSEKFGSSLGAFNKSELNIEKFVTQEFSKCLRTAQSQVTREKQSKDKTLGQKISELDNLERRVQSDAQGALSTLSQQFSDAMGGLTGTPFPMNVSACRGASTAVQVSCLDDARRAIEELHQTTNFQMTIQGSNPARNVSFACTGMDGCVKALQNASTNITREKTQFETFKQNYVMKATQDTTAFRDAMRQSLSPYSSQVSQRLQAINSALSGMGLGSTVEIAPLEAEELEFDENGLPKPPKSILNAIGGGMTPPLLDVAGGNFSSGMSGISDGIQEVGGKMSEAQALSTKLKAKFASCKAESLAKLGEKVENAQSDLNTALSQMGSACPSAGPTEDSCKEVDKILLGLVQDVESIDPKKEELDQAVIASLRAGINDCEVDTSVPRETNPQKCSQAVSTVQLALAKYKSKGREAKKAKGGTSAGKAD